MIRPEIRGSLNAREINHLRSLRNPAAVSGDNQGRCAVKVPWAKRAKAHTANPAARARSRRQIAPANAKTCETPPPRSRNPIGLAGRDRERIPRRRDFTYYEHHYPSRRSGQSALAQIHLAAADARIDRRSRYRGLAALPVLPLSAARPGRYATCFRLCTRKASPSKSSSLPNA